MADNAREIVLDTLLEMERNKVYSHQMMKAVLEKYDYLDPKDKRFIKRLTEGCIERKIELDYLIEQYATLKVNKMKPLIRCVLRMGVYQIIYMDSVPDSAACNEAVKLTVKRKFTNLKGFVNGILRRIESNKDALPYPDEKKSPLLAFSVRYSMPEWIIKMWVEDYGIEQTKVMLQNLLAVHPVTIRFTHGVSEEKRKEYICAYENMHMKVTACKELPYAYTLEGVEGIANLPGYAEGDFLVQDISSMMSLEAVGFQATDGIIDVCACPGGKTIFAAELGKHVISRDLSEKKAARIQENIERMQLTDKVEVQVYDATNTDESLVGKMDVVIMDVPCSGLGVIGKKQDIKYNVNQEQLVELNEIQKSIVDHSIPYVKNGGKVVYSTCTIRKEENENMCEYIAKQHGLQLVEKKQILPLNRHTDGFFYGIFVKE